MKNTKTVVLNLGEQKAEDVNFLKFRCSLEDTSSGSNDSQMYYILVIKYMLIGEKICGEFRCQLMGNCQFREKLFLGFLAET